MNSFFGGRMRQAAYGGIGTILSLARRPLLRDVAVLASGTAMAQAITVAAYPFVTRLYGPDAFGALGMFMSLIAMAAPMAALAYPLAIVLPADETEARGLATVAMIAGAMVASLCGTLVLAAGPWLARALNIVPIADFLWLVPVAMLFSCAQQIMQYRLVRERRFRLTAAASVVQAIVVNLLRIACGLVQPVAAVLVNTFVAGIGLQSLLMAVQSRGSPQDRVRRKPLWLLAKRYRDFPLFRAPQDVLNAASQGLPLLVLAAYYGPHAAGFFVLARSVVGAPLDLVSTAVGNALYPRFAEAANRSWPLSGLLLKSTVGLFAIGVGPFALLGIFGPDLFACAFGERWREAGQYAAWIGIWMAVGLASTPSVRIIPVIGAQRFQLVYGIAVLIIRLTAMLGTAQAGGSASLAVLVFAIIGAVLNLVMIVICIELSRGFDASLTERAA